MSLENYLLKSNGPAIEIRYDFNPDEIEQLYKIVCNLKLSDYMVFIRDNSQDIHKYIKLTPSQRKRKKWLNHPQNLLLRMAALQVSEVTFEYTSDLTPICSVVDSGSYRKFHSIFVGAFLDYYFSNPFVEFPFQDEVYIKRPWKK